MISLGIHIAWLVVQATGLACAGWLAALCAARREARAAVVVSAAALVILLGATAAAFCPVPEVAHWSLSAVAAGEANAAATPNPPHASADAFPDEEGLTLSQIRRWLGKLRGGAPESAGWQLGWSVLAVCYVAGVVFAGLRLLAGWLAIRRLYRRSRPLTDTGLLQLAGSLCATLRSSARVDLRECDEPGLAATVGWRRPVIFLPPEWIGWSLAESRAVLAHELAHVRHRDYLIGLLSRLCQVLYFYHPLVHWLSARIRWEQEVAADAAAADAAGGRDGYVKALARLALGAPARTPAGALAWSAVSGATILRRIRMLQGTEKRRPLSWLGRGIIIGLLAGTALLLVTLARPGRATSAEDPSENLERFELGYLPPESKGFFAVRPAVCFKQPRMEAVSKLIDQGLDMLAKLGIRLPASLRLENIDQIVTDLHTSSAGTGKPGSRQIVFGTSATLVRMKDDFDWPGFLRDFSKAMKKLGDKDEKWRRVFGEVTEVPSDGITLYSLGVVPMLGPAPVYFFTPDRRTVVLVCSKSSKPSDPVTFTADRCREIIRNVPAARRRDWGAGLPQVHRAAIAVVQDNHDSQYSKLFVNDLEKKDLAVLKKIAFATLAVELGEGRPVRLILDAKSPAVAPDIERAVERYAAMLQRLVQEPPDLSDSDGEPRVALLQLKLATELLQSREAHRDGSRLEWRGYSSIRLPDLVDAVIADGGLYNK